MNKLKPLYLSLISTVLLIIAWPPLPTAFLLFIGWIPLFVIREQLDNQPKKHLKFWAWVYLTLFLFNTGATWWVWNASPGGTVAMLISNSLLMSLPFLFYSHLKVRMPKFALSGFVITYLAFEYWHFNWSAAWPWLTLGKGLASFPSWIQWYEFTGELGGTACILITNVWLANLIIKNKLSRIWQPFGFVASMIFVSYFIAYLHLSDDKVKKYQTVSTVISQPNIDPYEEKFGDGDDYLYPEIQLDYAIEPTENLVDSSTDILLMPETAIVGNNDESDLNNNFLFQPVRNMTRNSKLCIIAGAETFGVYTSKERPTSTARYDSFDHRWFDYFNTAVNIKNGDVVEKYHKSKLVPGVEKMPFPILEKLSINLGGTSGSLGISDRVVNFTLNNGAKVAPLICYESVFGDYACEYVKDGAQLLAVVTNDGWWGETPGYKQHLLYGAVRCIETRRDMIRSANTGVSAYINKYGSIVKQTKYKERTAFKCQATLSKHQTFYVSYGNIIGRLSYLGFIVLFVIYFYKKLSKKAAKIKPVE